MGRADLIGPGKKHLVPPARPGEEGGRESYGKRGTPAPVRARPRTGKPLGPRRSPRA
jgi:hypothetical protein